MTMLSAFTYNDREAVRNAISVLRPVTLNFSAKHELCDMTGLDPCVVQAVIDDEDDDVLLELMQSDERSLE